MITKEQAIDILEKFDFFQGQRAGRELWNDKPFEVQEQDIKDFARDVALLKEYIADVVPKSEVEKWYHEYHIIKDELKQEKMYHRETEKLADKYCAELQSAKAEVAREIFADLETELLQAFPVSVFGEEPSATHHKLWVMVHTLKKKYTENIE